eukprot:NODE_421_length_927_cov_377.625622_g413_i0.p1 GENE.NODE_421_length_927_cov_377.625622_g413_i0~~NODE_421_length_927_cov_377.625622_g413_i0.p1  ORF type:complete len:168 (-),score=10.99 NODE_421_length_927_cov_377.625622_g413_i0:74-577(-)
MGANYAPTIMPQILAKKAGYSQILWLGPNNVVTEVGAMNLFMLWINEQGEKELITAPLGDMILPGVTRDCVLQLSRDWNEFKVAEAEYTIEQVLKGLKEDRVLEIFGTGTAAIVSPVNELQYEGTSYTVPCSVESGGAADSVCERLMDTLLAIQYGRVEHPWSVVLD